MHLLSQDKMTEDSQVSLYSLVSSQEGGEGGSTKSLTTIQQLNISTVLLAKPQDTSLTLSNHTMAQYSIVLYFNPDRSTRYKFYNSTLTVFLV